MVQALISQSPDIQKVLAFDGAFEKLFNIVTQEGGVEGGAVANGALTCVDGLLRFNTSNQASNYFISERTSPNYRLSKELFPGNFPPTSALFASAFPSDITIARHRPPGVCSAVLGLPEAV